MPSALQKLSEDLIVYSVLLADHERLDFKNDALAGVRANYFNSGGAPQSEETEMTLDGRRLRFRYEMKKDAPLAWKISGGNQPVQTVSRGPGGSYCVLVYTDDGAVRKRSYFDREHIWLRTEYYGRDGENALSAVVSPFYAGGLLSLRVEKHASDGARTVARLFPSQSRQNLSCAALMYSNIGMLWYDVRFAPAESGLPEEPDAAPGFDFRPEDFADAAGEALDLENAAPLSEADIAAVDTPVREVLPEEEKPYSAYDKIQSILLEAHKTNKNIFGTVASYAVEEPVEEPAVEPAGEQQPEPTVNASAEPEPDVELRTPNGVYAYYGALDENGQRCGRGRTVSPDGVTVYDGEYRQDRRSGFGICYYKDGSPNYVGDWNDGSRSGRGVGFRRSDGTVHAGRWNGNAPNGVGARFDSDGEFLDVCRYENGVRSGKSLSFDESGNVVIRVWEDGELISERVITDEE